MATKLPFTGNFRVTSIYGQRGNLWSSGTHQGIDLVGITNQKVYSICEGIIEKAGYENGGFGNYVRIKENGTENRIYLAHLEKIYKNWATSNIHNNCRLNGSNRKHNRSTHSC